MTSCGGESLGTEERQGLAAMSLVPTTSLGKVLERLTRLRRGPQLGCCGPEGAQWGLKHQRKWLGKMALADGREHCC